MKLHRRITLGKARPISQPAIFLLMPNGPTDSDYSQLILPRRKLAQKFRNGHALRAFSRKVMGNAQ
ncbi:hypothetical protein RHIZ404_200659 [Rhizobium sp. EC-SD404]|nr:hypothetical protein RHIZ404_200659 [Rhizobium sp. EC-SD404]